MQDLTELDDRLGSILNRCLITKYLIKQIPQNHNMMAWLPTLLEDIYEDGQAILDLYCIKEHK